MKKILYVILEQWADWELAYISSAVNMLGGGKFENKTVSLTKTPLPLLAVLSVCLIMIYLHYRPIMVP